MDKVETTKSLLKIAKADLKSSKLLYEKKLFPQSIFYFQQAVEKGNKALVIYGDYFTLANIKSVSHNQTKLVKEVMKKHLDEVDQALSVESRVPNFFRLLKEYNFDFSTYRQKAGNIDNDLIWMNNETELSSLTGKKLNDIINMVEVCYKDFDKLGNGKLFVTVQTFMLEFLNKIRNTEVAGANVASSINEEWDMDNSEISKVLGVILIKMISVSTAAFSLHVLGFIFDRLVSKARYPFSTGDFDFDPMLVFTKKLPLIKKLPELHHIVNRALRDLEKTIL